MATAWVYSFRFLKDDTCSQHVQAHFLPMESQMSAIPPLFCPLSILFHSGQQHFCWLLIRSTRHSLDPYNEWCFSHTLGVLFQAAHVFIFLEYFQMGCEFSKSSSSGFSFHSSFFFDFLSPFIFHKSKEKPATASTLGLEISSAKIQVHPLQTLLSANGIT